MRTNLVFYYTVVSLPLRLLRFFCSSLLILVYTIFFNFFVVVIFGFLNMRLQ